MADDHTQTAPAMAFADTEDTIHHGLCFAHHPDLDRAGYTLMLAPGEQQILGREAAGFPTGLLTDPRLSRKHLEVRCDAKGLTIRDLGSHNGTTLNSRPASEARLQTGDVVGIGDLLLIAVSAPPMHRSAPAPAPVGISSALHEVLHQLRLVAQRDTTVMLLGETGVGKEVLARHLHELSGRPGRFVAVNTAGLTESVVESTLFGHTRGAFTGAARSRPGLAQSAAGGTLFLDEVGDAPQAVQVALLRLLQEREILPVGADSPIQVDVRFVSATHQNLDQAVEEGRLRADLRARLDQWSVEVPPLRDRREDILPLAHHFAAMHTQSAVHLSLRLASALLLSDWPGNARELEAFMERVVVSAAGQDPIDATQALLDRIASKVVAPPREQAHFRVVTQPSPEELRAVLQKTSGNMSAAAKALGVSRSTIYRWLRAADIDPASYRSKISS